MRAVRKISSFLAGSVLFIAGLLKLMDPVGSSLIVEEYFKFFHIGFLSPASMFVGEPLSLLETLTGAAVITGIRKHLVAVVSGVMLAFFTIITVILLIFNPQMECGCFGQAIHLTHFQSFIKNVVLLGLWALAYVPFGQDEERKVKLVSFALTAISVLAFMVYSLFTVPLKDFTPFAPGEELEEAMPLSFCNREGEYADSLATGGRFMAISVYNPSELSGDEWKALSEFRDHACSEGFCCTLLVSGECPLKDAYSADRRTLLTLNRSNGGATFICDSQIVAKWCRRSLPSFSELSELYRCDPVESSIKQNAPRRRRLQGFMLYVYAVMLLL